MAGEPIWRGGWNERESLALDVTGNPVIAYYEGCRDHLRIARGSSASATVRRGEVTTLVPGWKLGSLPLTSFNDDRMALFPYTSTAPALVADDIGTTAPLVLYRVLGPGDIPSGDTLFAVKSLLGVELSF